MSDFDQHTPLGVCQHCQGPLSDCLLGCPVALARAEVARLTAELARVRSRLIDSESERGGLRGERDELRRLLVEADQHRDQARADLAAERQRYDTLRREAQEIADQHHHEQRERVRMVIAHQEVSADLAAERTAHAATQKALNLANLDLAGARANPPLGNLWVDAAHEERDAALRARTDLHVRVTAYRLGYETGKRGDPADANPYNDEGIADGLHHHWHRGWSEGDDLAATRADRDALARLAGAVVGFVGIVPAALRRHIEALAAHLASGGRDG